MNQNRESIFLSGIRSFVIALFAILGICIGIFLLLLLVGGLDSLGTGEIELTNKEVVLPNANNVRQVLPATTPVILQIDIHGIIGGETLNMQTIRSQLVESREGTLKNDRVKAILISANTPGGTVTDADGIYRSLKEYKERYKVPVYMFVDGMCASGGMYVASAADKVYSTDTSIIGSIGVLVPTFMNFSKTLDKIGVETLTITAGKDKDAMNPLRPWKPGEENNYRSIIEYYYDYFVNLVVSNRPRVDKEKLINDYGANIFPAVEAQEIGFIDEAGKTRGEVLLELAKVAGLEGKDYQVVRLESKNWFADLFRAQAPLFSGKITHHIQLNDDLGPEFAGKALYLYRPES